MPKTIEGVLTAIVTPFTATGSLNIPALKVQVNRQLEAGNAIFCGGTNGEFFVLNEQEKLSVTVRRSTRGTAAAPTASCLC